MSFFSGDSIYELNQLLVDTEPVSRHNRVWRFGGLDIAEVASTTVTQAVPYDWPPSDYSNNRRRGVLIFGQLGFERADVLTEIWDQSAAQFVPQAVPSGVVSPFVVRSGDLQMIFQPRGQDIPVSSFISAFRALLRGSSGENSWDLRAVGRQRSFAQWRDDVDRVTRLNFHTERPNPNYEGRPGIESIMTQLGLETANYEFRASDGINTNAELVKEMLDHTDVRGYGDAVAVGERRDEDGTVTQSVYQSQLRGGSEIVERELFTTNGTVPYESLTDELMRLGQSDAS